MIFLTFLFCCFCLNSLFRHYLVIFWYSFCLTDLNAFYYWILQLSKSDCYFTVVVCLSRIVVARLAKKARQITKLINKSLKLMKTCQEAIVFTIITKHRQYWQPKKIQINWISQNQSKKSQSHKIFRISNVTPKNLALLPVILAHKRPFLKIST